MQGYNTAGATTALPGNNGRAIYFRTSFSYNGTINSPRHCAAYILSLWAQFNDGAIFYLNGAEILRWNMPNGTVGYNTPATASVDAVSQPFEK